MPPAEQLNSRATSILETEPSFFSLPAGSHAFAYGKSETNAAESDEALVKFLSTILAKTDADRVHLIAHFMGNRVLLDALSAFQLDPPTKKSPLFDQIIFASPDVDQSEFAKQVAAIESLTNGMTLYASGKDVALKASTIVNCELDDMRFSRLIICDTKRAGLSPPPAEIIEASEKLVVIDTSTLKREILNFIDHSDYANGAFNDVRSVIWTGAAPHDRCVLQEETRGTGLRSFWFASQMSQHVTWTRTGWLSPR